MVLPALVLAPLGSVGAAGAVGAAASGVAATAPASTSAATAAADITQPNVAQVALGKVDNAVLKKAPKPTADDHSGELTASATTKAIKVKPAAAASIKVSSPAELVAVASDAAFPDGSSVQVRVREKGKWSAWTTLHVDADHGPDPDTEEAEAASFGSDPLLAQNAQRVQLRIDTPSGKLPSGTRLTLVDAPTAASDNRGSQLTASAVGQPAIISRAQWGANESWRNRAPIYTSGIRAGFVHHTASTSKYSAAGAAAQVRAIYAYHTKSLKHSDIDYNFVVDRFGRLYEGRAGGIDQPVMGGHTAGFNSGTFAVVTLGNFQTFKPGASDLAAIKDSIAKLAAWKLALHGVNPGATVKLVSAGYIKATRYPKGSIATLPALSSHQMVNYTSCPGKYIQAELPSIRAAAAQYSDIVLTAPSPANQAATAGTGPINLTAHTNRALTSWTADVLSPCSDTPVRSYSGTTSGAGTIDLSWDLRDAAGTPVLPTTYTVRMSGVAADGTAVPMTTTEVTVTPVAGGAWGPCGNASRVVGDSPATTSVLWGRIQAPAARTVVLTGTGATPAGLAAGLVAAPLARAVGAPLLVTPADGVASTVVEDLRARQVTEVLIVGGADVVPPSAEATIASLGAVATRLAGATPAATAAAVAARFPAPTPAVLVSPDLASAHAVAGAGLAAATGSPLLLGAGATVPAETIAAAAGRTSVTVVDPGTLPDAALAPALAGIAWSRVAGADTVAAGAAVAAAFPGAPTSSSVLPVDPTTWATAPVAAAAGGPVLFSDTPVLSVPVADALRARPSIGAVTTTVSSGSLADAVLGATSRVLLGLPWAPPGVALTPAPSTTPAGVYKVKTANGTPEPVRKGRTLKVTAKVTQRGADRKYRKVAAGTPFSVQFKASGTKGYVTVATGVTTKGKATAKVAAQGSGKWRIVVGTKASKADTVRVRK